MNKIYFLGVILLLYFGIGRVSGMKESPTQEDIESLFTIINDENSTKESLSSFLQSKTTQQGTEYTKALVNSLQKNKTPLLASQSCGGITKLFQEDYLKKIKNFTEILISYGADVNQKVVEVGFTQTPLSEAIGYLHDKSTVELLLAQGSILEDVDDAALEDAPDEIKEIPQIKDYLAKKQGLAKPQKTHKEEKPEGKTESKKDTPTSEEISKFFELLYKIEQKDSYESVKTILQTNTKTYVRNLVNVKNEDGTTPLHALVKSMFIITSNQVDAIKLLAANQAEVNAEDTKHHTPLYYAILNDHEDAALCLLSLGASDPIFQPEEKTSVFQSYCTSKLAELKGKYGKTKKSGIDPLKANLTQIKTTLQKFKGSLQMLGEKLITLKGVVGKSGDSGYKHHSSEGMHLGAW